MTGLLLFICLTAGIATLLVGLTRGRLAESSARMPVLLRRARTTGLLSPLVVAAACAGALVLGVIAWSATGIPILALAGGFAGGYAPFVWARRRSEQAERERERAWPAVLAQLADALETGIAFPAAVGLLGENGPAPLRAEFARFHTRLRTDGLTAALDGLAADDDGRTSATVVLFIRAGLVELPAGGLAPLLRELAAMLAGRFEAREKARSRSSSLQLEAAILAISPLVLLLLVGSASPAYMAAYRTGVGTAVAAAGGLAIFACYLAMRRLGRIPDPGRSRGRR